MNDKLEVQPKPEYKNNEHWFYRNQYCVATIPVKEVEGEQYVKLSDIQHMFSSIKKAE